MAHIEDREEHLERVQERAVITAPGSRSRVPRYNIRPLQTTEARLTERPLRLLFANKGLLRPHETSQQRVGEGKTSYLDRFRLLGSAGMLLVFLGLAPRALRPVHLAARQRACLASRIRNDTCCHSRGRQARAPYFPTRRCMPHSVNAGLPLTPSSTNTSSMAFPGMLFFPCASHSTATTLRLSRTSLRADQLNIHRTVSKAERCEAHRGT